jgi:hypothetical protein
LLTNPKHTHIHIFVFISVNPLARLVGLGGWLVGFFERTTTTKTVQIYVVAQKHSDKFQIRKTQVYNTEKTQINHITKFLIGFRNLKIKNTPIFLLFSRSQSCFCRCCCCCYDHVYTFTHHWALRASLGLMGRRHTHTNAHIFHSVTWTVRFAAHWLINYDFFRLIWLMIIFWPKWIYLFQNRKNVLNLQCTFLTHTLFTAR